MISLLSTTIFSIAEHLTDADTAKLPRMMFEQHDPSPASPDWLLGGHSFKSHSICPYDPSSTLPKDIHSRRKSLAQLVFAFSRMQANIPQEDLAFDSSVAWRILGDEVVLHALEVHTASSDSLRRRQTISWVTGASGCRTAHRRLWKML
jgi:hypothetical protein